MFNCPTWYIEVCLNYGKCVTKYIQSMQSVFPLGHLKCLNSLLFNKKKTTPTPPEYRHFAPGEKTCVPETRLVDPDGSLDRIRIRPSRKLIFGSDPCIKPDPD